VQLTEVKWSYGSLYWKSHTHTHTYARARAHIYTYTHTYTYKGKVIPLRPGVARGWVEVQLYSSMTAALEGGEWPAPRPGRNLLPPGKTRYPFYRRLGGPQGRSGRAENLVPTKIRSRTVQPIHTHTHTHTFIHIFTGFEVVCWRFKLQSG